MIYWKHIERVGFPPVGQRVLVVWEGVVRIGRLNGDLGAADCNDTLTWEIEIYEHHHSGCLHATSAEVSYWSETNLPR